MCHKERDASDEELKKYEGHQIGILVTVCGQCEQRAKLEAEMRKDIRGERPGKGDFLWF